MHESGRRLLTVVALLAILGFATSVRLYGVEWDDNHHLHPDERFLAIVSDKIRFPANPLDYFDTRRSTLNPYNARDIDGFAYGMVPLFLTRAVAEQYGLATYDGIPKVGRVLSALFDVGTVLLVFLLGRLVYGRGVGLVAATISAATVTHIQLSHFYAVDTFLAFATTLALYAAYRAWLRWGVLSFVLLGFAAGLALATKLSAALLAPIVLLAVVLPPPHGQPRRPLTEMVKMLAICGIAAFVTYRVGEPYSFLGPGFFGIFPNMQRFEDLNRWVKISSGEIEVPFMIQWANTPNPRFALTSLVEWGLGPLAGITALTGLLVAGLELTRWRQYSRNVLLVIWAAINLGYFGFQFAKFMRYFLPVYPALAILAAYLLLDALPRLGARVRIPAGFFPRVVTPIVLTGTVLFAVAFITIYSRPNTRVTASAWIFQNVPANATLGVEHWDDALPLRLPGFDKRFQEVSLQLYDDESPEKVRKLVANLDKADYIILASNRLYGSIPRLPKRYPIAIEYYRALFDGRLGFDKVAQFDSHPGLFGMTFDSSQAQEDFTVYDHPTVTIFKKRDGFAAAEVERVLGAVSLDDLERTKPVDASARRGLMLSPTEWERVQTHGTWRAMFALDGATSTLAAPLWLLLVSMLGLAAFPICWLLLPGLADRGYGVARILGLVFVAYLAWLAASVTPVPFGSGLAYACLLLMVAASAIVVRRHWSRLRSDLRAIWPRVVAVEVAFLLAFLAMLVVRSLNPDIWHATFGGEKPMDFAYLNAVVKSPSFPPYDPWFAGGYINYYYYGFVLVAVLIHLTAIPPHMAYNLAIATIFAMTAAAVFSLAMSLMLGPYGRRRFSWSVIVAGAGSALAVCVLGNLDGALQLLEALWRVGGTGVESGVPFVTGLTRAFAGLMALAFGAGRPGFDFWRSTRFIGPEEPGPIHEFPYFTFLYGDLHAHMLSMPIQVAALAIGFQAIRLLRPEIVALGGLRNPNTRAAALRLLARPLALLVTAGLLVGTLRATNTWELPTYLALAGLVTVIATRPGRWVRWPVALAVAAVALAGVYVVSSLLFAPFLARYELFYSGVVPVKTPTAPSQFLLVNGALLFVVGSYLASVLARSAAVARAFGEEVRVRVPAPAASYLSMLAPTISLAGDGQISALATALLAVGLVFWAGGYGTLSVLMLLGGVAGGVAVYRRASRETLFVAGLAAAAIGSLALPDVVAVKGDVGRMNTVFKFYLQAWIILGLLAGPSAVLVWRALFRPSSIETGLVGQGAVGGPAVEQGVRGHHQGAVVGGAVSRGAGDQGAENVERAMSQGAEDVERAMSQGAIYRAPTASDPVGARFIAPDTSPASPPVASPASPPVASPAWSPDTSPASPPDSTLASLPPGDAGSDGSEALVSREMLAGAWKYVWAAAVGLLVLACVVYPILATRVKVGYRFAMLPPSLDGMAYMAEAVYRDRDRDLELPADYDAIRWLLENVEGTPVILEGYAPLYHWGARYSIYTGLPVVLGWDWHQKQQRSGYSERVDGRLRELNRTYESPDPEVAWATIRKYGVRLIVVGGLERAYYPAAGLAKFDRMVGNGLEVVYSQDGVTIYQVITP